MAYIIARVDEGEIRILEAMGYHVETDGARVVDEIAATVQGCEGGNTIALVFIDAGIVDTLALTDG